jgi:hypothetical protein
MGRIFFQELLQVAVVDDGKEVVEGVVIGEVLVKRRSVTLLLEVHCISRSVVVSKMVF